MSVKDTIAVLLSRAKEVTDQLEVAQSIKTDHVNECQKEFRRITQDIINTYGDDMKKLYDIKQNRATIIDESFGGIHDGFSFKDEFVLSVMYGLDTMENTDEHVFICALSVHVDERLFPLIKTKFNKRGRLIDGGSLVTDKRTDAIEALIMWYDREKFGEGIVKAVTKTIEYYSQQIDEMTGCKKV